ncbi:carbonic anhydrase 2-like [Leptopilina boulardi]|uniref:carbonic anhydrase 2-like n=1 Tax=Leptopilina boulardi TaxID=63433 RepID=UPI0021F5E3FE|nr:carbonic anhydrase 2-like [Leptopilina boulardi]
MSANVLKIIILIQQIIALHCFDYKHVDQWKNEFPMCGGRRQSPININLTGNVKKFLTDTIKLNDYWRTPLEMTLTNDGHSVKLTTKWPDNSIPNLSGGLRGRSEYLFDSLHFHWSRTDDSGTEHSIDRRRFALEMHIVHYNKKYGSILNAVNRFDGLTVIGLIFQINDADDSTLSPIVTQLRHVTKKGETVKINPFPLSIFDLDTEDMFITYEGSLTTPPCSETVTWLLTQNYRYVTNEQIKTFRQIKLDNGDEENVRPIQPINQRLHYFVPLDSNFIIQIKH